MNSKENNLTNTNTSTNNVISDKKPSGLPTSRVINSDYLSSLGDIFKCNICFNIMVNPSDCEKCGHSYCLDCITNFNCPYNCEGSKISPCSVGIKVLLNNLLFKCNNEGCLENIPYNAIWLHDSECLFKLISCPKSGCALLIAKKYFEQHIKEECKYVTFKCKYCSNEFYKFEIQEHQDTCETIFLSLNSSQDGGDMAKSNGIKPVKTKKYLEALNINLAKLVKDNDNKLKTIEDENNKMKNELSSTLSNAIQKFSENLNKSQSEIKIDQNHNKDSELINSISEIIKKELNDYLLNRMKDAMNQNYDSIQKNINNLENYIKNLKQHDNKFDNDQLGVLKQIIKETEKNILLTINDLKINFIKEIKNITIQNLNNNPNEPIKNNETRDDKIFEFINDNLIQINSKITNNLPSNYNSKTSLEEKQEVDIEKISKSFLKNVIEIVGDKTDTLQESVELKVDDINKNLKDLFENVSEELENLKIDITTINKNTREIKSIISEEFSEMAASLKENKNTTTVGSSTSLVENKRNIEFENNIMKKLDKVIDIENQQIQSLNNLMKIEATINEIPNKIIIPQCNNKHTDVQSNPISTKSEKCEKCSECDHSKSSAYVNNYNSGLLARELESIVHNQLSIKLDKFETKLNDNFNMRLKEMYDLKWCNECEKVDYFFGFIKCDICIKKIASNA